MICKFSFKPGKHNTNADALSRHEYENNILLDPNDETLEEILNIEILKLAQVLYVTPNKLIVIRVAHQTLNWQLH